MPVCVSALAAAILAFPAPSQAVPFSIITGSGFTINSAMVDGGTGIDLPLWLVAHEAVDLRAPGVLSVAAFEWAPGDPNNPNPDFAGNFASYEGTSCCGITGSLALTVSAAGAHVAAGQAVTDGTDLGFQNGYDTLLQPGQTTITPAAAGMRLSLHVQGWQPNFDNISGPFNSLNSLYWRVTLGQHYVFWRTDLFFQATGPTMTVNRPVLAGSFAGIGLPAAPTYTPVQVPEPSTLATLALGVAFATRKMWRVRRRAH